VSAHGVQIVDDTDQVVREYRCDRGVWSPASVESLGAEDAEDAENSIGAAAARAESNLDTNTSNYHLEATASEHVGLELTLLGSAASDRNAPHIAAEPIATAQHHVLADGGRPFQSSSPSVRLRRSNDDNASSASTFIPPFSLGQAVSLNASPLPELELPVSTAEQSQLISAYLRETGTWCETTDSDMHFTVSSVHEMMESKAFAAAAMALASRQLDALQHRQRQVTLGLYQHAIQLLIHHDPSQADAVILATCTLLCVYEMMASDVGEWRRHLKVGLSKH
jgi:hypothetical protein